MNENPNDFKACCDCKYFYDLHFDFSGYHNCCSNEICYLCNGDYCTSKEVGKVPEGKRRGEWDG